MLPPFSALKAQARESCATVTCTAGTQTNVCRLAKHSMDCCQTVSSLPHFLSIHEPPVRSCFEGTSLRKRPSGKLKQRPKSNHRQKLFLAAALLGGSICACREVPVLCWFEIRGLKKKETSPLWVPVRKKNHGPAQHPTGSEA